MKTSYILFTVNAETGRITRVGIYSSNNITTLHGEVRFSPAPESAFMKSAESYQVANDYLRNLLPHIADIYRFARPIREALLKCAETGEPANICWND